MFPPHRFPAFGVEQKLWDGAKAKLLGRTLQKKRKTEGADVQVPQEACPCSGARQNAA